MTIGVIGAMQMEVDDLTAQMTDTQTEVYSGGYAMVPLIQDEIVDKRKWIDKEDFIDLLALTQSVPGIFAVNIAIFIGYKLRKFRGALAMAFGTILPSFFIILAIALFFQQFKQYPIVENIFMGIRPAVVALIAAPTFSTEFTQFISDKYGNIYSKYSGYRLSEG